MLGLVEGNVVHSKHSGRDLMAGLKAATQRGADAVIGVRHATSAIRDGMSELVGYGTAVKPVGAG